MLRAVFGVDPKLSDVLCIEAKTSNENYLVDIEFDTGETIKWFPRSYNVMHIPKNVTEVTITSDEYITHYGCYFTNSSIISIEEFTSDSIINCNDMFYGFENLQEVKNINLRWDKITHANSMCSRWYSFNGILPDNFCSNMSSLKEAMHMFSFWSSFNQELPNDFCLNMVLLKSAYNMFYGWELYNQKLPNKFCNDMTSLEDANGTFGDWKSFNKKLSDKFCSNMISLRHGEYMFCNWNSYSYELPDNFCSNMVFLGNTICMFFGWWSCNKTPKYDLHEYIHDYKHKDIDELNYLLEKHKEQIIDYQLLSKLSNKEFVLCIKGNIDHYFYIIRGNDSYIYDTIPNHFYLNKSINENKVITIT